MMDALDRSLYKNNEVLSSYITKKAEQIIYQKPIKRSLGTTSRLVFSTKEDDTLDRWTSSRDSYDDDWSETDDSDVESSVAVRSLIRSSTAMCTRENDREDILERPLTR